MNTEETFDQELLARVTPALDATLGAPPSAAAAAAIAAAAHSRARGVRIRRRTRFTLSFAVPLAACFAIVLNMMWQSPHPAPAPYDPMTSMLTVVDVYQPVIDVYYDEDDDDDEFFYEEIQYAAPVYPLSPFAIFSHTLVAMQESPLFFQMEM